MNKSSAFSPGDLIALCCAILMLAAFVALTWLTIAETAVTGLNFWVGSTPELPARLQVPLPWLVPLAAAMAGIAALVSFTRSSLRQNMGAVQLFAGFVGLLHFGLFILTNTQSRGSLAAVSLSVDALNLAGAGFFLALLGALGLIAQAFIPRQGEAQPRATPARPFASGVQRALVLLLTLSFILIGQQIDRTIYQVGLLLLIIGTLTQIAFGNIPPGANFRRSIAMLVAILLIISTIVGLGVALVPSLIRFGRG